MSRKKSPGEKAVGRAQHMRNVKQGTHILRAKLAALEDELEAERQSSAFYRHQEELWLEAYQSQNLTWTGPHDAFQRWLKKLRYTEVVEPAQPQSAASSERESQLTLL